MPGPWPITLITWNQLEQDAEPPVFEFGGGRLFKGPGGQKGPNYMAVMRRPEDALDTGVDRGVDPVDEGERAEVFLQLFDPGRARDHGVDLGAAGGPGQGQLGHGDAELRRDGHQGSNFFDPVVP